MDVVLVNNRSALECWERGYARNAVAPADLAEVSLAGHARQIRDAGKSLAGLARPVEVLVSAAKMRCRQDGMQTRVWGRPLPEGSICIIPGTNIAVARPWFCYLQMAARLPFPQAALLGMELCGAYSTLPFGKAGKPRGRMREEDEDRGFVQRPPLADAMSLRRCLETALPEGSEAMALAASRQLADNSHSPAESRIYLRLFASVRRGGYGLPRPLVNARIPLPPHLREVAGCQGYVCDFLYPERRLGIEFDGGYHWNDGQRLRDNQRELILDELGIQVLRVDKRQISSEADLGVFARALARRLGVRLREPGAASAGKRAQMRTQLTDYSFDLYA